MSRLVETIRAEEGKLLNISFHNERMIRSLYEVFGIKTKICLEKLITVPETVKNEIFKCRVEYDHEIRKVEFLPYRIKVIRSLKLVEDNTIEYAYKFTDRRRIEKLNAMRSESDDILIIKNGMVTDSSYANVVFRDFNGNWVTPSTYLLPGTRRANLLKQGMIKEKSISYKDFLMYSEVKLINAMIGLDDTEGISVRNIMF
jgi:4-amino-4-deoxychorismate lyase